MYARVVGALLGAPVGIYFGVTIGAFAASRYLDYSALVLAVNAGAGGFLGACIGSHVGPRISCAVTNGSRSLVFPLLPLLSLALLYAFVLAVRIRLGHWPAYGDPESGLPLVAAVIVFAGLATTLVSPLVFLFFVPRLLHKGNDGVRARRVAAFFTVSYATWIMILRSDPGQFLDWFLD